MMNNYFRLLIFVASSMVLTLSCLGQDSKVLTVTIEPYKRLTYDAFFKKLSLKSQEISVEYLDKFDFKWGTTYRVKLKQIHLKNPPADASSIVYKLLKIISQKQAGSEFTFDLRLERDLYLGPGEQINNFKPINDSTFVYMDEIELEIPDSLRFEFDLIIDENESKKGKFKFLSNTRVRLLGFSK